MHTSTRMSSDPALIQELRSYVIGFRVAELQMLLGFAQKNRSGKKHELQARALNLLSRGNLSLSIENKIRELHRQRSSSSSNNDSQTSEISSSCYSSSKGSSSINLTSLPNSSTPGGPNRIAPNSSSILKPTSLSTNEYYSSMPRGLSFDYQNSSSNNSKSFMSSSSPLSSMSPSLPYPVLADVKFKQLPFFDVLGELLKPATLMPSMNSRYQENSFTFHLTPQQANEVSLSRDVKPDGRVEHVVQIQLRFCLMETSCDQDDNFPPGICVKVNSKMCPLPNPMAVNKPGVEPKRPSRPVNITTLCRISPTASNQITISWTSEYNRAYAVGVFLVRRLSANNLLQRIRAGGVRNSEYTRAMIKEKLAQDPDSEIKTMILRGSLLCPLGKMRIQLPCRAVTCTHIQCFDALLYLQMNEKKPAWVCPVCDKSALYNNLVIDGLFTDIINQAPIECTEVQFHEDGSWSSILPKKDLFETLSVNQSNKKFKEEASPCNEKSSKKLKSDIEVVTLDSEDDEESERDINNSSGEQITSSGHPSTPILSSGSSSGSDTPNNISSLPSPDSSTGSSVSPNLYQTDRARSLSGSSFSTPLCYATSNSARSGINSSVGIATNNPIHTSNGSGGRDCLNNISYSLRSNSSVSSSSYNTMPLLNTSSSPHPASSYYPQTPGNPFSDAFNSTHRLPFSNFDLYYNHNLSHGHGNHSLFNGDLPREVSYRSGSNSSGARHSTESGPELISLD